MINHYCPTWPPQQKIPLGTMHYGMDLISSLTPTLAKYGSFTLLIPLNHYNNTTKFQMIITNVDRGLNNLEQVEQSWYIQFNIDREKKTDLVESCFNYAYLDHNLDGYKIGNNEVKGLDKLTEHLRVISWLPVCV